MKKISSKIKTVISIALLIIIALAAFFADKINIGITHH